MNYIVSELVDQIYWITLNRPNKRNAFDDVLLTELQQAIHTANNTPEARIIVLNANGPHFSAGADMQWMRRMAQFSEAENLADAKQLAQVLSDLYHTPKPTVAMVQGSAFGGGAGLAAVCDIVIAADTAAFSFSEVKLGLIPAVISPYVIKAIGERAATCLFVSAEIINAKRATELNLVHHCVPEDTLLTYTKKFLANMRCLAPQAMCAAKQLVREVAEQPITSTLQDYTAQLIAQRRVSPEGQAGLQAFLEKRAPDWQRT